MLTDTDKRDILEYAAQRSDDAIRSDLTRIELVTHTTKHILVFLAGHPDMCASEISDYLNDKDQALADCDRFFKK